MIHYWWSLILSAAFITGTDAGRIAVAQAPGVVYFRFTPRVVPQSSSAPVTFEVKTVNSPSTVSLALESGSVVSLVDNGSGVDAVAGDGVYSVALRASDVLHDFTADDVNRNFVGYLRLYQGATQAGQWNVLVDVLTSEIPSVTVTQVSPKIQYSDHLVNVVDPTFFPTQTLPAEFPTWPSVHAVARAFYARFADAYDILNIVSEIAVPRNAGHTVIKNAVANIGLSMGDTPNTQIGGPAAWGSAGRLSGATTFNIPTFFDGASGSYLHEFGHQWVNYLTVAPLNLGIGGHWPVSDLISDIMGYAIPGNPQGLRCDCAFIPTGSGYQLVADNNPKLFSDLSLYLMGIAAPSEVGDHFVFVNQNQDVHPGATLQGPVTTVSISAVIAAMGPRTPVYGAAPTKFRVATILVSRDGLVSADAMRLYDYFAARAEGLNAVPVHVGLLKEVASPFAPATRGRGRLDTRIMHRVLVDASRDGGIWWYPQAGPFKPTGAHQGKRLADYLRSHGYLVDELARSATVTSALLQPYDIIIRAGGVGGYSSTEISAYQTYVQNGGKLLLLADHMIHAPTDGLAQSLGIEFGGVTRGTNQLSRYASHPITTGVGALSYQVGSAVLNQPPLAQLVGSLSLSSYVDLNNNSVRDGNEPWGPSVLGVMGSGTGRVLFCGDTGLWLAVPQRLVDNVLAWFEE